MSELIKELLFEDDCRSKLIAGVSKVAKAVSSTMGPSGKTVVIESPEHTKSITVTKDGATVAKSIFLLDPVENMAATILKEASMNTALTAGDGTTCSIVLAEALILEGNKRIVGGVNQTQVLRYLSEISADIIEQLKKSAIPCTDLLNVATISANNDESMGQIIADTYKEVGVNGLVRIEKSPSQETYAEITKGLKIDRGYASPMFINNREKKDQCIMEDVNILVCDTEISDFLQIQPVLEAIVRKQERLLIIAPCSQNLVNTLAANVMNPNVNLKVCVVPPPSFGYRQHELMEDIALSVGATYFSQQTGDDLSHVTYESLGKAAKIIVSKDRTEIIGQAGDETLIQERAEQLKITQANTDKKEIKDFINERIASLVGGVGIIYVGGNTDLEQKELYDRMEDAVCAVKAALEEGIVSGAGLALYEIKIDKTGNAEYELAKEIMLEAIKKPLKQILSNADLNWKDIYSGITTGSGYNLKTGKIENLVTGGVIDPLKVVRTALQNAVSVATTILSTDTSINIIRA